MNIELTGNDLRRFRLLVGLTQSEFATKLSLSQSVISSLESGQAAISERLFTRLLELFETFRDFAKNVQIQQAREQAAISSDSQFLTLKVWRWTKEFDLSRSPLPESFADLVMIRGTDRRAIALQMQESTDHYEMGETLVFQRTPRDDIKNGDLCLIQVTPPKTRTPKTMIAVAHTSKGRERSIQFQPVEPAGPILEADDDRLHAVLRLHYRGRYVGV